MTRTRACTEKIWLGESQVQVHFNYTPEEPATMYRSNGDPGDPGTPEEFDITKIELEVQIPEDLGPRGDEKRTLHVDITSLLDHLESAWGFAIEENIIQAIQAKVELLGREGEPE